MKRFSKQTGASLIMIIAVTAIVVVLSTAMVALVANAKNTRIRDRQRAQTFNAAEAAVDYALAQLAAGWPKTESMAFVWGATQEQAFKDSYLANGLAAQYPNLRVKWWFYDNTNNPNPVDNVIDSTDYNYDRGGPALPETPDGLIYIEVQAQDGPKSTRIRVLAERQPVSLGLPRGVAFYTSANLKVQGSSDIFGVDAYAGAQPPLGTLKAYVGTDYDPGGGASSTVPIYVANDMAPPVPANVFPNSIIPELGNMINQAVLDNLRVAASSASPTNYYTSPPQNMEKGGFTPTIPGDPNSIEPLPPDTTRDDLSGLVYIKATSDLQWQPNGQWNSPSYPGILIIDGAGLQVTSNADYYGLVYLSGGATDLGTLTVHGMVISAGDGECYLSGNQIVRYNDEVWRHLSEMYTASVRIVPNTWRELQPLPASVVFPP